MYIRVNAHFKTDNDLTLKGWLYSQKIKRKSPCVIMTHGFSALKEHYLDKFAKRFADTGLSVLVYDNRNFGESDGTPRLEVDPVAQIRDLRNAITYLQKREDIDSQKIALWGTSFSGGVVLVTSAIDKRVRCVVSQVPFISGHHKFLRITKPEQWIEIKKKYEIDRLARLSGKEPAMINVVTNSPEKDAIMKDPSAFSFFTSVKSWQNNVTLRSIENAGDFEPIAYIKSISPTPLLFIVASNDSINKTDLSIRAYKKAFIPKKLIMIEGDHFSPYIEQFELSVKSACEWFCQNLL